MSAGEEQMEAHRADEEARARAERERREAFVRALKETYDEAYGQATRAFSPDYHFTIESMREAQSAALLAVAQRACRIHVADLLRIECDLNAITLELDGFDGHRGIGARFAVCAAVGALRRLRARMRGKVRP